MAKSYQQVSISAQIKKLSVVRKRLAPDTAKFLEMLNDSLAQYGKSLGMDEFLRLESDADCDLRTAEAYGRLLGSNIGFESVNKKVYGNPVKRISKLKRAIVRYGVQMDYMRNIDVDKPPAHRIAISTSKLDDEENPRGFYSVEIHATSGDMVEFEHIRLGVMRLLQKAIDRDQEELDEIEAAAKVPSN